MSFRKKRSYYVSSSLGCDEYIGSHSYLSGSGWRPYLQRRWRSRSSVESCRAVRRGWRKFCDRNWRKLRQPQCDYRPIHVARTAAHCERPDSTEGRTRQQQPERVNRKLQVHARSDESIWLVRYCRRRLVLPAHYNLAG